MNICELALRYGEAAALLRGRISELERERKSAEEEERQLQLESRLRPLRSMYRETRAVERHLARYGARAAAEKGRDEA